MPQDLALDVDGNLLWKGGALQLVEGPDAVAQHLRTRLRFFLGEWFLDQREGVPYFRDVLVKNPNLPVLSSIFRQVIAGTPGVDSVPEFRLAFDKAARHLAIDFTANLADGGVLTTRDDGPFVVEV